MRDPIGLLDLATAQQVELEEVVAGAQQNSST
eukprot:CAMPEP_0194478250 /NCGR_PEP_ID=MMETSP0253-20130528/1763_1 /TAXON_ID=2966 /ORGANISM="Noctiluca scintillans" /LENGTH=31 /DNA_ID= /DNA_START= /DNA_END= /DNA_ORIENTATION=